MRRRAVLDGAGDELGMGLAPAIALKLGKTISHHLSMTPRQRSGLERPPLKQQTAHEADHVRCLMKQQTAHEADHVCCFICGGVPTSGSFGGDLHTSRQAPYQ